MESDAESSETRPSAVPPLIAEHHVRLPEQLGELLRAAPAHGRGIDGSGIRVAVIDSGFYPHPFYVSRGYRIVPVPTRREPEPLTDEYGHGTAQLASLFAIAPRVEALVIKCMDRDPSYALEKAIDLGPAAINCAWGFNIDHRGAKGLPGDLRRMHRLLQKAVRAGISVVAAGGNGQQPYPGCMPEVIAAGGVYYAPDGGFHPSDVSSKFTSTLFPGRQVPDLCGLVGNRPHGRLLLVPVPPRAKLARRASFSTIAAGSSDAVPADAGAGPVAAPGKKPRRSSRAIPPEAQGWAMFSGTSAATAMITGAIALLLQARPGLSPAELKELLVSGARVLPASGCRVLDVEAALARL